MVKETEIIKKAGRYSYIVMSDGSIYPDAVEFSPITGKECCGGFYWELQHQLCDILEKQGENELLNYLFEEKGLLTTEFNPENIPENLKNLLNDRKWFDDKISNNRKEHESGKLCGGLGAFVDAMYSVDALPLIAKVPLKYCPFCGALLPEEFKTDEWWKKRGL